MKHARRHLAVGFFVILGLASAGQAASAESLESLTITVFVRDYAHVSGEVLRRAEEHATRIYRAIGVDMVWLHASDHEPAELAAHNAFSADSFYTLIILSPEMTKQLDRPLHELGTAPYTTRQRGYLAYVFYEHIETVARLRMMDETGVLGAVMAHEVGHLLLPSGAHSTAGIMRADWDETQFRRAVADLLRFTTQQAEFIRGHVSSAQRRTLDSARDGGARDADTITAGSP